MVGLVAVYVVGFIVSSLVPCNREKKPFNFATAQDSL
jgi:hypothetical protein